MVKPRVSRAAQWSLLAGCASLLASPALADDLREALVMAYNTNPSLQAARAQQRATDEGVPIARSAGLPGATSTATYTEFSSRSGSAVSATAPARNFDVGVQFNVPLYTGGSVRNSVRAAETRVVAGRADLRGTESDLFVQVVAAYMDVLLAQNSLADARAQAVTARWSWFSALAQLARDAGALTPGGAAGFR